MIELLDSRCKLKFNGYGKYSCAKIMHCPKIGKQNGIFGADCFKKLKEE